MLEKSSSADTKIAEGFSEAWNQDKTRRMNLHDEKRYPGRNCPYCNGSGWICLDWANAHYAPCSCQKNLKIGNQMQASGRSERVKRFRLKDFEAVEAWQTQLLKATCGYAKRPQGFLYICGQPGSGKTHLAAGAFNYIMEKGSEGRYYSWPELTSALKAMQNQGEYVDAMAELKGCPLLFLDDFLHAAKKQPTSGDLKLAFEIINARYENDCKPTIITSNMLPADIDRFDSSLSGRIVEAAQQFLLVIRPDPKKDYRAKNILEV